MLYRMFQDSFFESSTKLGIKVFFKLKILQVKEISIKIIYKKNKMWNFSGLDVKINNCSPSLNKYYII